MSLSGDQLLDAMASLPIVSAEDSSSLATKWLSSHNNKLSHFINGKFVTPVGDFIPVINPSTGEKLAELQKGEVSDVNLAVAAAKNSFEGWRNTSGHDRAKLLLQLAKELEKSQKLMTVLEAIDTGRNIKEIEGGDVPFALRWIYHYIGWAHLCDSEFKDYNSVGVVATIVPWSYPLLFLCFKVLPAIAAGNTVVLKPSSTTSLSALLFAELCKAAGFPPGVVNVLLCDRAVGEALVSHPDVSMIRFNGSLGTGKHLREVTAGTGKRLGMELGGKGAVVIFDSADLDSACEALFTAIWLNAGQTCSAGSRVLIQESVYNKMVDKLKARLLKIKVGHALDKNADVGAINTESHLEKIKSYVELARQEGAQITQAEFPEGCFYPPTLITDIQTSSKVVQEQIFGPVLCALPFRTAKEAIALANNTIYGLASAVFTENSALALEMAKSLKSGIIWVNCYDYIDPACGWGGFKQSGLGREGGREGFLEFMKPKWNQPSNLAETDVTAFGTGAGNAGLVKTVQAAPAAQAKWASVSGHERALKMYSLADKIGSQKAQIVADLQKSQGVSTEDATKEFSVAVERLFYWAAVADKHAGEVKETIHNALSVKLNEPVGVIGVFTPDSSPLVAFCSLIGCAVSRGNFVLAVPSKNVPKVVVDAAAALPAYKAVDGDADVLARQLADAEDVNGIWYFGSLAGSKVVELKSASNLKRTWVNYGQERDWINNEQGQGVEFLANASQCKHVWFPIGDIFAN